MGPISGICALTSQVCNCIRASTEGVEVLRRSLFCPLPDQVTPLLGQCPRLSLLPTGDQGHRRAPVSVIPIRPMTRTQSLPFSCHFPGTGWCRVEHLACVPALPLQSPMTLGKP